MRIIFKHYLPKSNIPIIAKKCARYKTPHTLKPDVFELPDNKNIEKLFSEYELFFPNQASFQF